MNLYYTYILYDVNMWIYIQISSMIVNDSIKKTSCRAVPLGEERCSFVPDRRWMGGRWNPPSLKASGDNEAPGWVCQDDEIPGEGINGSWSCSWEPRIIGGREAGSIFSSPKDMQGL